MPFTMKDRPMKKIQNKQPAIHSSGQVTGWVIDNGGVIKNPAKAGSLCKNNILFTSCQREQQLSLVQQQGQPLKQPE